MQGNPQKSRIGATDVSLKEKQRDQVSRRQCGVAELSWRLGVSELDGAARQHEPRHGARAGCQDLRPSPLDSDMGNSSLAMSRASLPVLGPGSVVYSTIRRLAHAQSTATQPS